jgi:glycosyltransferase involved in cell wall biosynthesis
MYPSMNAFRKDEGGIKRVIEAYRKYLPNYGFEFVPDDVEEFDLSVSHAGSQIGADILHCHGLYWTEEYQSVKWELHVNANVIASARYAKEVIVPSEWVAESFKRDMRLSPHVIGHGIDAEEWEHDYEQENYVLWNKNRNLDVCDPYLVGVLADAFPAISFVSTFPPHDFESDNLHVAGILPHEQMKEVIQRAGVYLSTTKETFGIGVLEAMASGVPVLGVDYGGNSELIEHGINGYLVRHGEIDDLIAGLKYCFENRDVLGRNGKEIVKTWTWEKAFEQIAEVYKLAMVEEPPTVAVVIPTYNYADKVERAIESAINQNRKPDEIIVVNDGSTDDTERVLHAIASNLGPEEISFRVISQPNSGVAVARNAGIAAATSKFVCCLDADDAIDPRFLEICVPEIERDRSLGIVYTGLKYIKPTGEEGVSSWPGQFDYDKQLEKRNQIPTCCVFRRKMWERLGGYKQRYAPGGAGAEDAEFWLRAGAYGWDARKVANFPLFLYSWESGRVSGDPNYQEVDWTAFHPWAEDGRHPFASVATPENGQSHWVRSYDQPSISIIIPVGREHVEEVRNALDSLEAQTIRSWEVILVWDTPTQQEILDAYPYVHMVYLSGGYGAGYARNRGAEVARADYLLFLDADDWLYPKALENMMNTWAAEGAIAYSDYVGKAFVDEEYAKSLGEKLLYYDYKKGEAVIRHKAHDYNCERAIRQPDPEDMYHWCLITAIVPKAWHDEIGGFDENMESWEDWDYWIRMARSGKCFVRIPEELVVYRFYTGTRRERGLQEYRTLVEYIQRKLEGESLMPCGCGGGRASQSQPVQTVTPAVPSARTQGEISMNDENMILVLYKSLNRGQHNVVGQATGIKYGYRGGGERFYVHKQDIDVQSQLFQAIDEPKPKKVAEAKPPPPKPTPLVQDEPRPEEKAQPAVELEDIPGITSAIAENLRYMGVKSVYDLMDLDLDELMNVKGMGEKRAQSVLDYLEQNS